MMWLEASRRQGPEESQTGCGSDGWELLGALGLRETVQAALQDEESHAGTRPLRRRRETGAMRLASKRPQGAWLMEELVTWTLICTQLAGEAIRLTAEFWGPGKGRFAQSQGGELGGVCKEKCEF